MESSKLTLIYRREQTPHIITADGINSLYLHSVLNNELVVRVTPHLPSAQVLCVAFEKDDVTIPAFVMAMRESTILNSTHEVYDDDNSTVETRQDDFGIYEWYTRLPQPVLENAGQWKLSLSVFEPLDLDDPIGTMPIATSGVFTFNVNNSLAVDDEPVPTYMDILNLYVTAVESAENAEAWAVGERYGIPVPTTDETYHNNSKYWAEQAQGGGESAKEWAENAEAWAVGERNGQEVDSDDETYHNNSKFYSTESEFHATQSSYYAGSAGASATSAEASATNAEASATSASQSAENAQDSETSAEASATSASESATSAEASAQRAEQIASGIVPSIAVSIEDNPDFDSTAQDIEVSTALTDVDGKVWQIAGLKVGGTVWVIEDSVPDRWITSIDNGVATLRKLTADVTIPVTKVNSQIGEIETYKQSYSATAHYYRGDFVSNTDGDLLYLCIQTAPIGTALSNRAYFRAIALLDSTGKIAESVLPAFLKGVKSDGATSEWTISNGVATAPIATTDVLGVSKPGGGLSIGVSGAMYIQKATNTNIAAKTDVYKPIVPSTETIATKASLGVTVDNDTSNTAWDDTEATTGRSTLQATKYVRVHYTVDEAQ